MNRQKNVEIKGIFSMICILFGAFLLIPMIMILQKSFMGNEGFTLEFYKDILGADFLKIFINSVGIAMASAVKQRCWHLYWHTAFTLQTYLHLPKKEFTCWRLCRCFYRQLLMDLQLFIRLENRGF